MERLENVLRIEVVTLRTKYIIVCECKRNTYVYVYIVENREEKNPKKITSIVENICHSFVCPAFEAPVLEGFPTVSFQESNDDVAKPFRQQTHAPGEGFASGPSDTRAESGTHPGVRSAASVPQRPQ